MGWEDFVFTVLGGFIASFSGILTEWWRENRRLRDRHFDDIKHKCLEPILNRLSDLKHSFVFGESGPEWGLHEIEKLLKSDVHWWESFSFKGGLGANQLLYDDLKNHYPDLYRDLQDVEKRVRAGYTNIDYGLFIPINPTLTVRLWSHCPDFTSISPPHFGHLPYLHFEPAPPLYYLLIKIVLSAVANI